MTIRKNWPALLFTLTLALLAGRLAWMMSTSSTGSQPHLEHWLQVATGLIGMEPTPNDQQDPPEQARFWLDRVSRTDSVSDDPVLAMGAAWMLDTPQGGYIARHQKSATHDRRFGFALTADEIFDRSAINRLTLEFDAQCAEQRESLIEAALRLDEFNPEWWRAKALMAFQVIPLDLEMSARRDDWLAVLDECARHDPDNALYDYLAALQLWSTAAEYDWTEDGYEIEVADAEVFAAGEARLAAGLSKPHLMFETGGYAATVAFLEAAGIARTEHVTIAVNRDIDSRALLLQRGLHRWMEARAEVAERDGELAMAIEIARNDARILDQISEIGNSPNAMWNSLWVEVASLADFHMLAESHPDLLVPAERTEIINRRLATKLDLSVRREINKRLNAARDQGKWTDFWMIYAMVTAQSLCLLALVLALGFATFLFFKRQDSDCHWHLAWWLQILAWLAGLTVSFVIWGMCPAGLIPASLQRWAFGLLMSALSAGLLVAALKAVTTRAQIPLVQAVAIWASGTIVILAGIHHAALQEYGLRLLMALPAILTCLCALGVLTVVTLLARLIIEFARARTLALKGKAALGSVLLILAVITALGGGWLTTEVQRRNAAETRILSATIGEFEGLQLTREHIIQQLGPQSGAWTWAMIQWQEHHGPTLAVLISVFLMLYAVRRGQRLRTFSSPPADERPRRHSVMAGACGRLALASLFAYLCVAPLFAGRMEAHYHDQYNLFVTFTGDWDRFRELQAEVESDESLMQAFHDEAENQIRESAEMYRRDRVEDGESD